MDRLELLRLKLERRRARCGPRVGLTVVAPEVRYDEDVQELRRITADPAIMGGKTCIRGMRVTAGIIVESIAAGRSIAELLADFPHLQAQDIR